jgi:hypothetical protein
VLEHDLLEAIVALPTDTFCNTGIATCVWILSNPKVGYKIPFNHHCCVFEPPLPLARAGKGQVLQCNIQVKVPKSKEGRAKNKI